MPRRNYHCYLLPVVATTLNSAQYYDYRKHNKNEVTENKGQSTLFILVHCQPFLLSLINKTYLLTCNDVSHLCNLFLPLTILNNRDYNTRRNNKLKSTRSFRMSCNGGQANRHRWVRADSNLKLTNFSLKCWETVQQTA